MILYKGVGQNGFDVIMSTQMLGFADVSDDKNIQEGLSVLKANNAYTVAENTIKNCIKRVDNARLKINADEIKFGLYVSGPEKLKHSKVILVLVGYLDI